MVFRRSTGGAGWIPTDPIQLYLKLAESNSGPESLWFHQGKVLENWHENHSGDSSRDVAIELPTGAGKTLVGGLIGEYRRRAHRDRVAYLCPTRQLARQTAAKLTEYGIENVLLTGRVPTWNAIDRARYSSGQAIAVSVYSHVFNSNPALDDAQLLLLDDAHAAGSAVAGPWSLEISRSTEPSAYHDMLSALTEALDPQVLVNLRTDADDGQYRNLVHLVSPMGVAAQSLHLERVLATAKAAGKLSTEAVHALKFLEGHVDRCLLYVSYGRLLLRPLIPPTVLHPAFEQPARRVYMSATLGEGGELERIFGRPSITRIPIPQGWEKSGTGRRLFVFPTLAKDLAAAPATIDPWVASVVAQLGRAVVLTPDKRTATTFTATRLPQGFPVLHAADVEDDLTAFTSRATAALVLSNRYDGVDLPDDRCRLVVLDGLPAAGDLQERFLHHSLGAKEVLDERIRARIMQGAGRATRNNKDYAVVLVLDTDLVTYLTRGDVLDALHPEIHAEVKFGFDEGLGRPSAEILDIMRVFLGHGQQWQEVDGEIVAERDLYTRIAPPSTVELQKAVRHEVAAWDAIWKGEWDRALNSVRQVTDALRGGQAPQRYAALWLYLGACIAHRLAGLNNDPTLYAAAKNFYDQARHAGRRTSWLTYLDAPAERGTASPAPAVDALDEQAMTSVLATAVHLAKPSVFESTVHTARAGLLATPHKAYEKALVTLGELAGADPSQGDGGNDSAPDATWIFADITWVVWETKSEAKPDGELGSVDTKQAGGHLRFVSAQRAAAVPGDSTVLLMTPQERIAPNARACAEEHVFLVRQSQVIELVDRVVRAWNTLRTRDLSTLSPADAAMIFWAEEALPTQWLSALRTNPIRQGLPSTSD